MPKTSIKRIYKTNKSNVIAIIKYPSKKYGLHYISITKDRRLYPVASINNLSSFNEAKKVLRATRKKARLGFLSRKQKEVIVTGKYMQQSTK